jgi:hypothetical protein
MISEAELVERIAPMMDERLRYNAVRSIIDPLEVQCYPPEEMFREEFIKRVEEAEKRVKEGKVISFKDADELNAFLESIESE